MDARRERYDAGAAWKLFGSARSITTARGKKSQKWDPRTDSKEEILKHAMGPSGNLRAPTFRINDDFVIGFSPGFYQDWVKGKGHKG